MEVIILAGGLGTRLRSAIGEVPKPMAPVDGKPFLHYQLLWLESSGVDKVVLSIGYKAEMITDHFGQKFNGISIEYAIEKEPLGTGGAILYAMRKTGGDRVLIVNGDTWFPVDIGRLVEEHESAAARLTIALKKMTNFSRYGTVELEGNRIVGFREKQEMSVGLINGGIYLMDRSFVENSVNMKKFSFETDILEKRVETGAIAGVVFDVPFIDIGVPGDYMGAGEVIKQKI
ncbi:MAG TPA: NTP transferase domain-containing protein [Bacteroidetes bacterium]|nr:NTP transferase domain-containing protein [Bacteroidota bacterium]